MFKPILSSSAKMANLIDLLKQSSTYDEFMKILVEIVNRPTVRAYPDYQSVDVEDLVDVLHLMTNRELRMVLKVLPVTDRTRSVVNDLFDQAIHDLRASVVETLLLFEGTMIRKDHIDSIILVGDYSSLAIIIEDNRCDVSYALEKAIEEKDLHAISLIVSADVVDTSYFTSDDPAIRALL